jgi:hypothetical protein
LTRASHNLSQTVLGDRWATEDAVEGGHGRDGVGVLGVGVDPLGDHGVMAVDARHDLHRDPGVQQQGDAGVAEVVQAHPAQGRLGCDSVEDRGVGLRAGWASRGVRADETVVDCAAP